MGKLTPYLEAMSADRQAEQLPLSAVLEQVRVGDVVTHVDYRDFRGRVVSRENGRCKVKVLGGWRGPVPTWPVGVPVGKLEVVG